MKKFLSLIALTAFLTIPQGAFAWTYDGLGSLNPFTNFGRGFGNNCGCERPKLTKCEKLHGVKIKGEPCGCAVNIEPIGPMYQYEPVYQSPTCTDCHRAF